jgi:hypothetical protein
LFLYFKGLNLANEQIAPERGIHPDDAWVMDTRLREGKPVITLGGEVECEEVNAVAWRKAGGRRSTGRRSGRYCGWSPMCSAWR